jgi:hypothetical protein
MTKTQYSSYLQSDLWITNRDYLMQFPAYQSCMGCGSANPQLHHSDYGYLGPIYSPPPFLWPLCPICHASIHNAVNKDVNLYRATHDFLERNGLPNEPVEHTRHVQTVKEALAHLKDKGVSYLSLGNRPHYICMRDGDTFILRVSTMLNSYDYRFLEDLNFPVRKAVLVKQKAGFIICSELIASKEAA